MSGHLALSHIYPVLDMLFLFVLLLDALNTNFFLAALPNLLGVVTWQSDLDQPPLELGPSPGPLDCCKYPHGTHGGNMRSALYGSWHSRSPWAVHKYAQVRCTNQYQINIHTYGDVPLPWYVIGQLALKPLKLTKMQEVLLSMVLQNKRKSSPCGEKFAPAQGISGAAVKQKSSAPGLSDLLRFHLQRSPAASVWHPAPPRRLLRSWAVDDLGRWCHWTWCFKKPWHRFSLDQYKYIYIYIYIYILQ